MDTKRLALALTVGIGMWIGGAIAYLATFLISDTAWGGQNTSEQDHLVSVLLLLVHGLWIGSGPASWLVGRRWWLVLLLVVPYVAVFGVGRYFDTYG